MQNGWLFLSWFSVVFFLCRTTTQQGMSQHIAHRVEKKQKDFQRGIELHQQGIDKGEFNGQQLQKELERLRTPGKSNNWFTWRRVHSGRGLYASWKDDGFFKYLFKELFVRKRSMPFITAATTWYLLLLNVAWVSDKKATKSGTCKLPILF